MHCVSTKTNNYEKSEQVALMGRIYKQCRQTWVSLGCPDEAWADGTWSPPSRLSGKLELLKSFVRRMWRAIWHHVVLRRSRASRLGVNHISDSLRLMQSMQTKHDREEPYNHEVKQAMSMLTWLATHGYWSRVWIAQEIALSKIDPICLIGKHQVPLLSLDTVFSDWSDGGFLSSIDARKPSWSPAVSQGLARAQEICMLRDEYLSMRQSLRAGHLTGSMDLPRILQLASHRNATVPHDYVYGLRSLLSTKNQESLIPDYNLSIRELYASVTKLLLQKERSVSLLCAAVGTGQDNPHDLSSWAFDFSKPLRLPTRRNDEADTHESRPSSAPGAESTDVLQLRGTCLDITITTAVPRDYLSAELGANETVSKFMQSDIYEASTRMNNAYDDPRPPDSESYHFFMTSHNSLGKCANKAKEGDQLWKLNGATGTFVLRPLTADDAVGQEAAGQKHRLVGPCAMFKIDEEEVYGAVGTVQII